MLAYEPMPSGIDFLVRSARLGDRNSLQKLFELAEPLIRRLSYWLQIPDYEASDCASEAWIGFWKAIRNYRGEQGEFWQFVKHCIKCQLKTALSKKRREKRMVPDESSLFHIDHLMTEKCSALSYQDDALAMVNSQGTLEATLMYGDIRELMERFNLFPLEAKVIYLKRAGYEQKEIAALLKRSDKSPDNAFQRAKEKIWKVARREGYQFSGPKQDDGWPDDATILKLGLSDCEQVSAMLKSQGLNYDEIAEQTGRSPRTVQDHCTRVRKAWQRYKEHGRAASNKHKTEPLPTNEEMRNLRISATYCRVIALVHEGKSKDEIALALGCSLNTVNNAVTRVREAWKKWRELNAKIDIRTD